VRTRRFGLHEEPWMAWRNLHTAVAVKMYSEE
jgi:hypothetical protein